MTLKSFFEKNGYLPASFIKDGTRFEFHAYELEQQGTGRREFILHLWQMKGTKKEHLYTFATGETEKEAQENMIEKLMSIE